MIKRKRKYKNARERRRNCKKTNVQKQENKKIARIKSRSRVERFIIFVGSISKELVYNFGAN